MGAGVGEYDGELSSSGSMPGPLSGVDGVGDAEGSVLGVADGVALGLGDGETSGVVEGDGETLGVAEGLADGEGDGDGEGLGVTGVRVLRPVAGSMPHRAASAGL